MQVDEGDKDDEISASDVAQWMVAELERMKHLYQEDTVYKILRRFGRDFVYQNENGNFAISKEVLKHFRKLTDGNAVWERGERMWRLRRKYDKPSRQQE